MFISNELMCGWRFYLLKTFSLLLTINDPWKNDCMDIITIFISEPRVNGANTQFHVYSIYFVENILLNIDVASKTREHWGNINNVNSWRESLCRKEVKSHSITAIFEAPTPQNLKEMILQCSTHKDAHIFN